MPSCRKISSMTETGATALDRVHASDGGTTILVEAEAVSIRADLLVYIWGGDKPQIGAVQTIVKRCESIAQN